MFCNLAHEFPENLVVWQLSGGPVRWVAARQGRWNHQEFLDLLANLSSTDLGLADPDRVGLILEETRRKWNLRRWLDTGAAAHWVAMHQGNWNHNDWEVLREGLQKSEFWPLDARALGEALEGLKPQWSNLRRWQYSGEARRWVETRQGQWDDNDWLALLGTLKQSDFWPLDADQVGLALEAARRRYHLLCWQETGELLQWVRSHTDGWNHDDWLTLLHDLPTSGFWPIDADALGQLLERTAQECRRLGRWRESGQALRWVESHRGQWDHSEWLSLLGTFQWSGQGPADAEAVRNILEEVKGEWSHRQELTAQQTPQRHAA
jgi:hypothetical protein